MFELYFLPILIFIGLALLAGLLLSIASVFLGVKEDEKVEKIRDCLPGINCGACGYSGCDDYAKAVANGAAPNQCVPGGPSVAKQVAEIMGVEAGAIEKKAAYVHCNGNLHATHSKYDYQGELTCQAASKLYSGDKACIYGCLGYGDCSKICPVEAISIQDGVAWVDEETCISCGRCVDTCPKNLIHLKPVNKPVVVACNNPQRGKAVMNVCSNGCIGCGKCQRTCQYDAIHVENFIARIDYEKCTSCGECIEQCPVNCIHRLP
ncbi:RnfABCDGE type electron transport complex subunit B [Massilioclostridium coli]|uniref:RnfABCDGE type electron transport complex subunit B n=1 Tax=Massilioclostridium coli TaxID=1870991 RepID=UPI00085C0483|nr:RnfABCDGE type electron transport complex subunit B [Massilioclostridium coli]